MIHVCFCFTDKTGLYSKFVGTTILSIFENSVIPPYSITVNIFHDSTLTDDNRDKFSYLAGSYSQLVKFYNVEELCADKIEEIRKAFPQIDKTRFSIATFYRFFIPNVLSTQVEKAIYLDSDILVNLDINELWKFELGENILGAVTVISIRGDCFNSLCDDNLVKKKDFFNAGVLLMNLRLLRKEEKTLYDGIKFIAENPRYGKLLDQDTLNYCFATRTLKLPAKFNKYLLKRERKLPIRSLIYHYANHALKLDMSLNYNQLWMSYFIRTPFFDADSMGRLYNEVLKMRSDLKNSAMKLSAIVAGKNRAFFVEPANIDSMKKTFSIHNDETIISAENENSIQKLIDAMKITRGRYVFFIMTEKFLNKNFPFDLLTKKGFVEGVDFVKGWNYLDTTLNSYPLVQAM